MSFVEAAVLPTPGGKENIERVENACLPCTGV